MRRVPRSFVPLLLILLAAAVAPPALAADIPRFDGRVVDRTGGLSGSVGDIESVLRDISNQSSVDVFVAFVPTTDELSVTDFAEATARANSLGVNDALIVVALQDRTDAIWVADGLGRITDAEIDAILATVLEPRLQDEDYAAGVVEAARALADAAGATATAPPNQAGTPEPPPAGGSTGGGPSWGLIFGFLALLAGGYIVWRWLLVRQAVAREAGERDRRTLALAREANGLLIAMDERIRTAVDEAGFVEAQYGESEAEPLRAAIEAARAELGQAFAIRQKLDDGDPEDPPTREAMLNEIIERLKRAGAALDTQAARIQQLRDLEQSAPAVLAELPARAAAQEARLPGVGSALEQLRTYAEPTWSSVAGNVEEARKGLGGARDAIGRGAAALDRGDRGIAAREVLQAEQGIAGATALLDAVERLDALAADLQGRLPGLLEQARGTLAEAQAAEREAGNVPGQPERDAQLAAAEAALQAAEDVATRLPLDPVGAHHLAGEAQTKAAAVLAALRQDAAHAAQLAAALQTTLVAARDTIERAADFVSTRHTGVGRRARTRLAEAERLLEAAQLTRDADPRVAYDQARRAHQLAAEAYALAQRDFRNWDQGGPTPGMTGGSDVAGAILGGIIGGILSGGGGRGGGWGGSPWGSPGAPRGGGGWGGGRSRGGSFGGFGGGGGGGGGGGRSRGGRW